MLEAWLAVLHSREPGVSWYYPPGSDDAAALAELKAWRRELDATERRRELNRHPPADPFTPNEKLDHNMRASVARWLRETDHPDAAEAVLQSIGTNPATEEQPA